MMSMTFPAVHRGADELPFVKFGADIETQLVQVRESAEQVNRAGSYLFEPAGSVHTLAALPDSDEPADAWFAIRGTNLNLDADGNVESVADAPGMLAAYLALAKKRGFDPPPVVVEP